MKNKVLIALVIVAYLLLIATFFLVVLNYMHTSQLSQILGDLKFEEID